MTHAETYPEFPNIVGLLSRALGEHPAGRFLHTWEATIYSCAVIFLLAFSAFAVTRRLSPVPGRLQAAAEALVHMADDFVCGIIGPRGRAYVPFIGTIFLYVLCMNLMGLVPFLKSATADWSITLALALCVFIYLQYTAFRELGIRGYLDYLSGKPRGALLYSVIVPVFMFVLHVVAEFVRPLSLSLRLRSNIWGDDLLLAILAGFGVQGFPVLLINFATVTMMAVIQAVVFSLLTTVYFSLVLSDEH